MCPQSTTPAPKVRATKKPTEKTVWDGRGDALKNQRFSIIDARAPDDLRLRELHFRVLNHLGRQNATRGWLVLSQTELAGRWECHRNRVNDVCQDLVSWGYVEKRTQQEAGLSYCLYKIRHSDDPSCVVRRRATAKSEGSAPTQVHWGDHHSEVHQCTSPKCTSAPPKGAPPIYNARAHRLTPTYTDKDSPNPSGVDAAGAKGKTSDRDGKGDAAKLLEALRAEGVALPVVEHLLRPILEGKRFSSVDRLGRLRELRDRAKGIPTLALDKAAEMVLALPFATIKPERIAEAIELVRVGGAMVPIRKGTAQWTAWFKYLEASEPQTAKLMQRFDSWQVRAPWPPGQEHPSAIGGGA